MKAVVAGATGLVGRELVELLLADEGFTEVVVFARRPLDITHEKLRLVQGALPDMNAHGSELGGDIFFSCLGTTMKSAGSQENFRKVDFHGVLTFARIAFHHKARTFVTVSAAGAHSQSKVFYNRVKGETEKALKDIGFPSLVIFRPGLLLGEREEKRPGERFAIRSFGLLRHVLPERIERKLATSARTLAIRMVETAKDDHAGLRIIESQDI